MEILGFTLKILAFIIACSAAILAILGWGAAGTAIGRARRLEEELTALRTRVERLEQR